MKKIAAVVVALAAVAAFAGRPWVKRLTVTTSSSYCFGQPTNPRGFINCTEGVNLAYGTKLADGGTHNVSDGGEPLVATTTDEPATFPGDLYQLKFGGKEQCFAARTISADAGTCDVYGDTSP